LVSWYLAISSPAYYGSSWMKQMWTGTSSSGNNGGMGNMMGNGGTSTTSTSYLWLIPVLLGAITGVGVIGAAFYYAFPELKYVRAQTTCNPTPANLDGQTPVAEASNAQVGPLTAPKESNSCNVLLKTMTQDEQKVLNVLIAHQGKYLQKYVVKEAGLSRLKTHRIVARFAQRGIVTVKEFGNTNEIVISDWVKR